MRTLAVALALLIAAGCGSSAAPKADETLNQMCVREVRALYEKHTLPTTHPVAEQPAICDQMMATNGVTTKAQLEVAIRQEDKNLSALDK